MNEKKIDNGQQHGHRGEELNCYSLAIIKFTFS